MCNTSFSKITQNCTRRGNRRIFQRFKRCVSRMYYQTLTSRHKIFLVNTKLEKSGMLVIHFPFRFPNFVTEISKIVKRFAKHDNFRIFSENSRRFRKSFQNFRNYQNLLGFFFIISKGTRRYSRNQCHFSIEYIQSYTAAGRHQFRFIV